MLSRVALSSLNLIPFFFFRVSWAPELGTSGTLTAVIFFAVGPTTAVSIPGDLIQKAISTINTTR